jgi:hypothetical protein
LRLGRVFGLVAALTVIALTLVHLRAEQVRSAARTTDAHAEWVELRAELWAVQSRSARLQTPRRLHERMQNLRTDLVDPGEAASALEQGRLASGTP